MRTKGEEKKRKREYKQNKERLSVRQWKAEGALLVLDVPFVMV